MSDRRSGLSYDLAWSLEASADRTLLTLSGELDMPASRALAGAIDELLADGAPDVVVDLRRLSFLDSSGLHLLERLHTDVRERGGKLSLVRGQDAVHRVFELAGLADRFTFVDSA